MSETVKDLSVTDNSRITSVQKRNGSLGFGKDSSVSGSKTPGVSKNEEPTTKYFIPATPNLLTQPKEENRPESVTSKYSAVVFSVPELQDPKVADKDTDEDYDDDFEDDFEPYETSNEEEVTPKNQAEASN